MKAVQNVDEKLQELEKRANQRRALGQKIDRMVLAAECEGAEGCAGRGLCPSIGRGIARLLGIQAIQRAAPVSTADVELGSRSQAPARATGSEVSRAVFGMASSKKKTPQSKLAAAADAMRVRVDHLEAKIEESRAASKELMQKGNKAAAIRELKRSKQLEKQAASTRSVMDAIDAQSDMLQQTQLQREVAAALGATAKTLKKDKQILSKAEGAVEAAHDVRDLHEDITQVMSELDTVARDADDDDILAELNSMMKEPDDPGGSGAAVGATGAESEMREIPLDDDAQQREETEAAFDALEVVRQYPAAPKGKPVEKVALLGDCGVGSTAM